MVLTEGYQQVLWLYKGQVVEVGASNIFFIFKDGSSGEIEIVTPELEDLILPGVTRDSILVWLLLSRKCFVMKKNIKCLREEYILTRCLKDIKKESYWSVLEPEQL